MSSRMKGNFWTVVMMIFFPSSMNLRRSPDLSACPTVDATWVNCRMVPSICRSSTRRSVMTMMESKAGFPSCSTPISCRATQAMELDFPLPAECWTRYFCPAPFFFVSERRFRTTSSW